jgi:hypothetical protein
VPVIDAFERSIAEAARWARGREIILFIGHGGAPTMKTSAAFDSIPEVTPFETHHGLMTEEVVLRALDQIRTEAFGAEAARIARYRGTGVSVLAPGQLATPNTSAGIAIDRLAQALVRAGALMRDANVRRLTILTCNVGQSSRRLPGGRLVGADFGQALADVLQTDVRLYDGWIATDYTNVEKTRVQIWITRDRDHSDWDQPSGEKWFHEVPDANPRNDGHSVMFQASTSPP